MKIVPAGAVRRSVGVGVGSGTNRQLSAGFSSEFGQESPTSLNLDAANNCNPGSATHTARYAERENGAVDAAPIARAPAMAAAAAALAQQPMGALSPSAANKAPQSAAPTAGIKTMK